MFERAMPYQLSEERDAMVFTPEMSDDQRVDELVKFVVSHGGTVDVDTVIAQPSVRHDLGREGFVQTINRAIAFGRIGTRDMLSVLYVNPDI